MSRLGVIAGITLVVIVVLCALSAADPKTAQADNHGWLPYVPDPGDIGDAVGGAAVDGMKSILEHLFGGIQAKVGRDLITWLVAIPNLTGGNVTELSRTTTAVAFGLLGVVMTFAVLRFWMSGLTASGAGGSEVIDGFTRTIFAALVILAWPYMFRHGVALTNALSAGLMGDPGTYDDMSRLIRAAIVGDFALGPVGWIIGITVALAGTILLLGLVLLKITLSAATAVLFVSIPIAIVLWPIPETSWLLRFAMRAMLVCLLVPVVWVLIFRTFLAVGVNALSFKGEAGMLDKAIIQPLTGCALLYLTVTIPRTLMRAAMSGARGPGGGFMSRMGSYMVARQASAAVSTHLPHQLGGHKPSSGAGSATGNTMPVPPTTASSGAAETTGGAVAGAASAPAGVAAGAAAAASAPNGSAIATPVGDTKAASDGEHRGETAATGAPSVRPAPSAAAAPAAVAGAAQFEGGTASRVGAPMNSAKYEQAKEEIDELARTAPPDARTASAAYRALSGEQQAMFNAAAAPAGAGASSVDAHLTREASGATGGQREALKTLAAARPEIREEAMSASETASSATQPVTQLTNEYGSGARDARVGSPAAANAPAAPASAARSEGAGGALRAASTSTPAAPQPSHQPATPDGGSATPPSPAISADSPNPLT